MLITSGPGCFPVNSKNVCDHDTLKRKRFQGLLNICKITKFELINKGARGRAFKGEGCGCWLSFSLSGIRLDVE